VNQVARVAKHSPQIVMIVSFHRLDMSTTSTCFGCVVFLYDVLQVNKYMGCSSSKLLPDTQSERDLNALHLLLRLLDQHVNDKKNTWNLLAERFQVGVQQP
jgi:hypothetical protein